MVRLWIIALVLLVAASTPAHAAGVRAVVDRNRATVGESIHLQVTIEDGDGEIDLSGLTDFKVLSRGSTNSFQMINGRTSRQLVHNYVLIPLKAGTFSIPAIPVTINGEVRHTSPISITILAQPSVDSGRRDVYVAAVVSDPTPWIGQQIIYTFRLFNAVQIADAKFQAPEFSGFNAEELEARKSHRTTINGREFIVTELIFILTPVKSGSLEIGPALLQVGLLQRSRRPKPFAGMDAFFGRTEVATRNLETDSIPVQVTPLPPAPPGAIFSGLVGKFQVTASLDKTDTRIGDSTTLAVTVSGIGNIMDAAAPTIPIPKHFKSYADNPEEAIRKDNQGYSGSKTFRTALVPVQPGRYHIDPIGLTYFDVDSGKYRNIATQAFDIAVSPAATDAPDLDVFRATPAQAPSLKKRVEFTGRDILPLKESLAAIETKRTLSPYWFGLFMTIPLFGFGIIKGILKMTKKDESPERIMADRAKKAIKAAASIDSSNTVFLSTLHRGLVSAILGRRGITGTSLTWAEARRHLLQLGWEIEDAAATARLLETIESFNYSGGNLDNEKRRDLLERTRQTVRRLTR